MSHNFGFMSVRVPAEEWKEVREVIPRLQGVYDAVVGNEMALPIEDLDRLYDQIKAVQGVIGEVRKRCETLKVFFDHDFLGTLSASQGCFLEIIERRVVGDSDVEKMCVRFRNALEMSINVLKAIGFWVEGEKVESRLITVKEFVGIIERWGEIRSNPKIDIQVEDREISMFGNLEILHLLVGNIFRNARSHGGASRVSVKIVRQGKEMVVELSDNGKGIDSTIVPRIFESGFTTRSGKGGVGLADARERMAAMNGSIECEGRGGLENKGSGKGAKFVLKVPLAQA